MIWYEQEEERKPDFSLEVDEANGRMVLDLIVKGILAGEIKPPGINPEDMPQALNGIPLTFGAKPNDNSLQIGEKVDYNGLEVKISDIRSCPHFTFYKIEFHYKG